MVTQSYITKNIIEGSKIIMSSYISIVCSIYCCDNHLSQGQMITQAINLLKWISSGNFTRELDKEPLLN